MGVWMRMSKSDKVVCSVVALLSMLAAFLAFAAEAKHVKPEEVENTLNGGCSYPKSSASALGITAAVSLLVAQVIGNAVPDCVCCTSGDPNPPRSNRTIAILCLVSWITFTISFILLISGAIISSKQNEDVASGECCKVVNSGVFASGAALALVTMTLNIVYYFKVSTIINTSQSNPHNYNIFMVEPQYGHPNVDARASKV